VNFDDSNKSEQNFRYYLTNQHGKFKTVIKETVNLILLPRTQRWSQIVDTDTQKKIFDILHFLEEKDQYRIEKVKRDINTLRLVYNDDGSWSYLNKLNTNTEDSITLLRDILRDSHSHNIDAIVKDLRRGKREMMLSFLKDIQKNSGYILKKYITNEEKYTQSIRMNTEDGDGIEDRVEQFLNKKGWATEHKGGNGDVLDMLLSIDLVVSKDHRYKCIQTKKAFITEEVVTDKRCTVIRRNVTSSMLNDGLIDSIFYGSPEGILVATTKKTPYLVRNAEGVILEGSGFPIPCNENHNTVYIVKN
jgi:hypothetical protein